MQLTKTKLADLTQGANGAKLEKLRRNRQGKVVERSPNAVVVGSADLAALVNCCGASCEDAERILKRHAENKKGMSEINVAKYREWCEQAAEKLKGKPPANDLSAPAASDVKS